MSVTFEHVTKRYGKAEILKDFSYSFPGEGKIAIVGRSGTGKSTLLHLISGIEKQSEGLIQKEDISKISYVFQEDRLNPYITVEQNLMLSKGVTKDVIEEVLEELEISHLKDQYIEEMSGGERRRVSIAQALSYDGDLFLLDEPFTGIDQKLKEKIIKIILEKTKGKLLLMVTHHEEEARKMADTILYANGLPFHIEREETI